MERRKLKKNNYKKFLLMLSISFIIMYFAMFLNVASLNHIYLSLTRFYITLLMVAPMSLVMIFSMREMYQDKKLNKIIIILSVLVFILALILLRTQTPISDEQYMKAMISHHSSAILTSENANLQDEEVKELARNIIEAQEREINQMKEILSRLN